MKTPVSIGQYSIVRKVGEGAMANVFLAVNKETFAQVAIKLLKPACRTEIHVSMLKTEIELGMKMQHANIPKVLAHDVSSDEPYLVMHYVPGVSLDHHQDSDSLLPIKSVISAIRQSANALKHAAEHGVVHRDIKPSNLILMKDGTVKVTDFGCAIKQGVAHSVAGSIAYMSPEQLSGEALSFSADMYALAVVAYRLLSARLPFEEKEISDLHTAILHFKPTPISTHAKIPPKLSKLIHQCLEKEVKDRPKNWDEFMMQLDNILHDLTMNPFDDAFRGFKTHKVLEAKHARSVSAYSASAMSMSAVYR